MKTLILAACALVAAGAVGCASTSGAETAANAAALANGSAGASDIVLTPISEPSLPLGKCGLILWTLEAEQPSAVFRMIAGENAEISIDGSPATLVLADASGRSQFGISEYQSFSSTAGQAELKFSFGLGFDGGVYVERGLLTLTRSDGWRMVTPVAGIAGCRTR